MRAEPGASSMRSVMGAPEIQCATGACQRTHIRSANEIARKNATENTDPTITVAYSIAESKLYIAWMISAPIPEVEPIHSPTMAPITDVEAEIFRAENR